MSDSICSFHNNRHKLYAADFLDIFTNIPHNVIVENLAEIISICFKNSNKKFWWLRDSFLKRQSRHFANYRSRNKQNLIYMLDYLLNNYYRKILQLCLQVDKRLSISCEKWEAVPRRCDLFVCLRFCRLCYCVNCIYSSVSVLPQKRDRSITLCRAYARRRCWKAASTHPLRCSI